MSVIMGHIKADVSHAVDRECPTPITARNAHSQRRT